MADIAGGYRPAFPASNGSTTTNRLIPFPNPHRAGEKTEQKRGK
jgi:hypothetical protein